MFRCGDSCTRRAPRATTASPCQQGVLGALARLVPTSEGAIGLCRSRGRLRLTLSSSERSRRDNGAARSQGPRRVPLRRPSRATTRDPRATSPFNKTSFGLLLCRRPKAFFQSRARDSVLLVQQGSRPSPPRARVPFQQGVLGETRDETRTEMQEFAAYLDSGNSLQVKESRFT